MGARKLRLCIFLFKVQLLCMHVGWITNVEALETLEATETSVSTVCGCREQLIPVVKGCYDVLWVLSGIIENAQMNAATVVLRSRNNRTAEAAERAATNHTARSQISFNLTYGKDFLNRIGQMFPVLDAIEGSITRLRLQRSFAFIGDDQCPMKSTLEVCKNMSSEITDAVHFMYNIERDEELAADSFLGIRLMVVEMNKKTETFSDILKTLKNMSCPEISETNLSGETDSRSFSIEEGESSTGQVECACVEKVLPEAKDLTNLLDWYLHILKETQGHALWTMSKFPIGRSALEGGERVYYPPKKFTAKSYKGKSEGYSETFLGVNFFKSFKKEPEISNPLNSRSAVVPSDVGCPLQDLLEHREKLQPKLNDLLQYREDVKNDVVVARNILTEVTQGIMETKEKLKEYNILITKFIAKGC